MQNREKNVVDQNLEGRVSFAPRLDPLLRHTDTRLNVCHVWFPPYIQSEKKSHISNIMIMKTPQPWRPHENMFSLKM